MKNNGRYRPGLSGNSAGYSHAVRAAKERALAEAIAILESSHSDETRLAAVALVLGVKPRDVKGIVSAVRSALQTSAPPTTTQE